MKTKRSDLADAADAMNCVPTKSRDLLLKIAVIFSIFSEICPLQCLLDRKCQKSSQAVQTTIAIVEAYAKLRELARVVVEIPQTEEDGPQQKTLLKRSGQLVSEILDSTLPKQSEETSFELNLAMVKFKHSVKREHNDEMAALKKELEVLKKKMKTPNS